MEVQRRRGEKEALVIERYNRDEKSVEKEVYSASSRRWEGGEKERGNLGEGLW